MVMGARYRRGRAGADRLWVTASLVGRVARPVRLAGEREPPGPGPSLGRARACRDREATANLVEINPQLLGRSTTRRREGEDKYRLFLSLLLIKKKDQAQKAGYSRRLLLRALITLLLKCFVMKNHTT